MSGIQAIQHYLTARKLQPLIGLGNEIHAIHRGTTYEAVITIGDLEAAVSEFAAVIEWRDARRAFLALPPMAMSERVPPEIINRLGAAEDNLFQLAKEYP